MPSTAKQARRHTLLAAIARRDWLLQMLALGAVSCGRRGNDPADARGSTVVMAVPDVEAVKPDNWDLDFLTFLPLAKMNVRGELEGYLASSWEHSPDHREYTFHLRPDVRWHDGVPVTAHDVKFTLDLLGHPDVGEYPGIDATVVDDSTVRIRAANPGYIDDISYFPKHLLEGLEPRGFWQWDFWAHPVGNGPYRFVRYVPETMLELERNPEYYGAGPGIERVILKFVGGAGLTELLAGNVDMAQADLNQIPRIARDSRFRIYHAVGNASRAIVWKTAHALFSDARVRRALTLALDRHELLRLLNLPDDLLPVTDGVLTPRQFRRGEWVEPLPYDPEQARRLLDEAGWVDRDGDGIREKAGRPFRFTASVSTTSTWGMPQLAVYVQDFFRRVGVQMEIRLFEAASMWDRLRAGDFEAWMHVGQVFPGALHRDFGRGNATGYDNTEAFAVIDELMATADPDEQDALYRRLAEIYRIDMPFTRLMPASITWFVHRRVGGLSTPLRASPDTYMEELWLEDSPSH